MLIIYLILQLALDEWLKIIYLVELLMQMEKAFLEILGLILMMLRHGQV